MAPKSDYAAQFKELKDLTEKTNTYIKLLENRRQTMKNLWLGYAMLKHKQRKPLTLLKRMKSLYMKF